MSKVKVRSARNYDRRAASKAAALYCADKSLAVQSQREAADINVIVKRFGVTGELPVSQRVPLILDIDEVIDYRTCMDYLLRARNSFDSLPARVRERFANDPGAFVTWAEDPANLEELRELGMAPKKAPEAPPAPPAPPAT